MGNSDAQKLGDGVDWLLMQIREGKKHYIFEQEADYPETIFSILHAYIKVWQPPSGAVPRKRQKTKFIQWVSELDQLSQIVSANHEEIFTIALETYNLGNQFVVGHPLALRQLLIDAVSKFNRNKDKSKQTEAFEIIKIDDVEKLVSPEQAKAILKDFKSNWED
jgi:hypothetical protein